MNKSELTHAQAEISFLKRMSSQAGISKLSKLSLEARSKNISTRIEKYWKGEAKLAKAALTFKGAPVWGTHGVHADFGSSATAKFSEAIAAVAASLIGPLGERGKIPNRAQNQILITDVAIGSFGFEFEEASPADGQLPLDGTTPVAQAFELFAELLEASTQGDDELSEPISKLGSRAIASVAEFLDKLAASDAYCSFSTRYHKFSFQNVEQVLISKSRLNPENIHEELSVISGRFLGTFPSDRKFEFISDDGVVIHGRIDRSIEQPAVINHHLNESTKVTFSTKRVGKGRPRYTLAELPW
ncbi:hypothetical protein [Pseudomonas sp. Marseille-Q5299]|uniref:hypothetical protein n=1 Tax=Pseudomonas sp. Marseille-Q5299 TaxID=2942201 RepID=UPI002073DDA5|nr:hypothetical protein [Pseudomonas sp. Marseille-Q5299]